MVLEPLFWEIRRKNIIMSNPYIEEAEDAILHTYNRYQIVLDKGEGVHLYDVNGKNIWILQQVLQYSLWATTTRSIPRH